MTDDEQIHAELGDEKIVRYDRAGKYATIFVPNRGRSMYYMNLRAAVHRAVEMHRAGGTIHLGKPGGNRFDREVRRLLDDA
jgi:hypothetical protein